MVSSSPQDEKQKNLKYKLKEPVILFTYHSSYVPFGWRRIRPVVLFGVLQKWVNVCFASSLLSLKSPSLSMTGVHENNFIARKIAVSDMNGQCSLHFELLFTVTCFKWLTEDLLKNDSPSKVRLSNSAAPKTARSRNAWTKVVKQKTFFTFSRMRRQVSLVAHGTMRLLCIYWLSGRITGKYLARGQGVRTERSEVRTSWPRAKYFPVRPDLTQSISILSYDHLLLKSLKILF